MFHAHKNIVNLWCEYTSTATSITHRKETLETENAQPGRLSLESCISDIPVTHIADIPVTHLSKTHESHLSKTPESYFSKIPEAASRSRSDAFESLRE